MWISFERSRMKLKSGSFKTNQMDIGRLRLKSGSDYNNGKFTRMDESDSRKSQSPILESFHTDSTRVNSQQTNIINEYNNNIVNKRTWWKRIFPCIFRPENGFDIFEIQQNSRLPVKPSMPNANVYDNAMSCLCFSCPKCLKAMNQGLSEPPVTDEKFLNDEPLEFLTECNEP